jgi:hypothetical protein
MYILVVDFDNHFKEPNITVIAGGSVGSHAKLSIDIGTEKDVLATR